MDQEASLLGNVETKAQCPSAFDPWAWGLDPQPSSNKSAKDISANWTFSYDVTIICFFFGEKAAQTQQKMENLTSWVIQVVKLICPLSVLAASPCFLLFGPTRWGLSTKHLCCFRSANAKTGGLGPGGLDSFWHPLMKGIERQLLLGGAPSKPQITNPSNQFTPPKTNCWFRTKPLRNE